jgi:hypothetical protein
MHSIICDPEVGANFLILLIAKRKEDGSFQATATAFAVDAPPLLVPLHHETTESEGMMRRLRKIIGF